jgi:hypothetical protein
MSDGQPLTRRELHNLVWSKPMLRIAEEFGVTGTGLAKICARHRVPTPPRGYWAKLQHGKSVRKAAFVELKDARLDKLVIRAGVWHLPKPALDVVREAKARQARQVSPGSKTTGAAQPAPGEPTVELHLTLALTAKALRNGKPDAYGAIHATNEGTAGAVVGAASVERALAILDALVRCLERRGFTPVMAGSGTAIRSTGAARRWVSDRILP